MLKKLVNYGFTIVFLLLCGLFSNQASATSLQGSVNVGTNGGPGGELG